MESPVNFKALFFLALGFLAIAGLIIIVLWNQKKLVKIAFNRLLLESGQRKRMLQAAVESQEYERKKIARDLHDDVGMMLMTMRVSLGNLNGALTGDLKELVDQTHHTIRMISWELMPPTLEEFGLINSLREMCVKMADRSSVRVEFSETGSPGQLDKNQELLLYRIAQEALTNALKHADATQIHVKTAWLGNHLELSITDNGRGFDFYPIQQAFAGRHGMGIYNLENRVALLGSKLTYKKNIPTGTIVSVKLQLYPNDFN